MLREEATMRELREDGRRMRLCIYTRKTATCASATATDCQLDGIQSAGLEVLSLVSNGVVPVIPF